MSSVKERISMYEKATAEKPQVEIHRVYCHPVKDKLAGWQKNVDHATHADNKSPRSSPRLKSAVPEPFDINGWTPKRESNPSPPPLKWTKRDMGSVSPSARQPQPKKSLPAPEAVQPKTIPMEKSEVPQPVIEAAKPVVVEEVKPISEPVRVEVKPPIPEPVMEVKPAPVEEVKPVPQIVREEVKPAPVEKVTEVKPAPTDPAKPVVNAVNEEVKPVPAPVEEVEQVSVPEPVSVDAPMEEAVAVVEATPMEESRPEPSQALEIPHPVVQETKPTPMEVDQTASPASVARDIALARGDSIPVVDSVYVADLKPEVVRELNATNVIDHSTILDKPDFPKQSTD